MDITYQVFFFGPGVSEDWVADQCAQLEGILGAEGIQETPTCWWVDVKVAQHQVGVLFRQMGSMRCYGECDVVALPKEVVARPQKWWVFDMDSTVIETEVIDELAALAGVQEAVGAITEQAMRGDLDFKASFAKRMAYLKGLDYAEVQKVADRLPTTPGLGTLVSGLKTKGIKTAIISGGFDLFAERLQADFGFDRVFAHKLDVLGGRLTGAVEGDVIDGDYKLHLLQRLVRETGAGLEDVVVVGDGANDIPMLKAAGLGIAYRAKPAVAESADVALSCRGLDCLLSFC